MNTKFDINQEVYFLNFGHAKKGTVIGVVFCNYPSNDYRLTQNVYVEENLVRTLGHRREDYAIYFDYNLIYKEADEVFKSLDDLLNSILVNIK
jgi:hypothetical protein